MKAGSSGLALAAALLLCPALRAVPAGMAFRWELAGSGDRSDPRLPALLRLLEAAARESWEALGDKLALAGGEAPVRWRLDLSPLARPRPGGEAPRRGEPLEAGHTAFAGGEIQVTIPAPRYLSAPERARAVVAHEAAHALVARFLGERRRYEALPRWFREGLALWMAGEGDICVAETAARSAFAGGGAASFLAGLAPDPAPFAYAEAYLAVRRLAERSQARGLRSLLAGVRGGEAFDAALRRVLGEPLEAFHGDAARRAREIVRELVPPERERRFRDSLRRREEGRVAEAGEAWKRLLAEDPGGALAPTLHYLIARQALREPHAPAGRAEAREHLADLLRGAGSLWRAEALVLQGDLHRAEGDPERARAAWLAVLEAFADDELPASQARERLGRLKE